MANQVLPWWAFALMGVGLVAFVAMLEMMRAGRIKVKQKVNFGEITIEGAEQ